MNMQLVQRRLREDVPRRLQQLPSEDLIGSFDYRSDIAACLKPLLNVLEWRGEARELAEALPHHVDDLSLTSLRNTLAYLGFSSRPLHTDLCKLDARLLPCLFTPNRGSPFVLLSKTETGYRVFDARTRETRDQVTRRMVGTAYIFQPAAEDANSETAPQPWFADLLARFRPSIKYLFGISLITNVFALSVPLFILALYDHVIPTESMPALVMLGLGICLILAVDFGLRYQRSNILSYIGGRLDFLIGSAIFKRLLSLSPMQIELAPLGVQIARLRELHAVRSIFVGPLCAALLDAPFIFLFLALIAIMGGWLVLVLIAAILFFVFCAVVVQPQIKARMDARMRASAEHQAFLVETTTKARAIKYHGMNEVWAERHRSLSAQSELQAQRLRATVTVTEVVAHSIKMGAGVGTLFCGILLVLNNAMSVGALIACMALIWRALSPLQVLFLAAMKVEQAKLSIKSINAMMRLEPEVSRRGVLRSRKRFAGRITSRQVGFRYVTNSDPSVQGITFDIKPGEFVAIVGPSGCGKSTILKLILGMYQPQQGFITIDGIDLRQLDRTKFRQSVAYLPQEPQFFHGTVAQNLRLANPTATDADLTHAAISAGIFHEIMALPEGFDTWLDSDNLRNLPQGVRQRLNLARTYVVPAPILLLDEPENGLDRAGDQFLIETLREKKQQSTILLVTHRPSYLDLADRILRMENGTLIEQALFRSTETPTSGNAK